MGDEAVVVESPLYKQALSVVFQRTVTPETVDQITDLIRQLRDASDCSKYLQGGCLAKLFNEKLWRKRKPDMTWMEYVEEEVGIGYRKAMYLISIYERAAKLGCTAEQLDRVGWVKARNILQIATREDVEDWLARAESQTNQEVERDVRMAKAKQRKPEPEIVYDQIDDQIIDITPEKPPQRTSPNGPPIEVAIDEPLENFTVRMSMEQKKNLQAAIEQIAMENSAPGMLMSRGNALDLMATEWRANHLSREQAIEWHCAQLARVYSVDIEVLPSQRSAK